uniref:KRAB domain-containing protein n=1 Tax=Anolis carolinensis TaxID=28377 RepID=A0A803TIW3_ANOCA
VAPPPPDPSRPWSGLVTFEDVVVKFSKEEWELLDLSHRSLYWEVMLANHNTVSSLRKNRFDCKFRGEDGERA